MEAAKRKRIEDKILIFAKVVTKGGGNATLYRTLFDKMNEKQFEDFWEMIKKTGYIPIFLDNFNQDEMVDYDGLLVFAKNNNIQLEQRFIFVDPDTGIRHMTPQTAMVGIVETSKQRQLVIKKMSVAKNDFDVEDLTGQAVGDSKGAGISNPENNILVALGLTTMAKELSSVKGGDADAYRQYKSDLSTSGQSTVAASLKAGKGAKSLSTMEWFLEGRHLLADLRR